LLSRFVEHYSFSFGGTLRSPAGREKPSGSPASQELFAGKVAGEVAHGLLCPAEGTELLRSAEPLDGSDGAARVAQVCVSAGTAVYRDAPDAVRPLLQPWGGEVLYFAHEQDGLGKRLHELGTPTIIEVSLPSVRAQDLWFPDVEQCLVGTVLGFSDVGSDVLIRGSAVPPEDILAVHQRTASHDRSCVGVR
jgi:hypothetical protein